jgi:hypothetical protein
MTRLKREFLVTCLVPFYEFKSKNSLARSRTQRGLLLLPQNHFPQEHRGALHCVPVLHAVPFGR